MSRRIGLFLILFSGSLSILWGLVIGLKAESGLLDFQAVYFGTRCLIEHHNPYNVAELESVYRADGGERPTDTPKHRQTITLYVNLPTTFLFVAPLAMLPWGIAATIWMLVLTGVFILAALAMWRLSEGYSPGVAVLLISILLIESELTFATANTAGIVIGLCLIAVWCFLENRFVVFGVLCLTASLAIKPHDAGLIWLYFILAGGIYRKRAMQAFLLTAVLGVAAILWVGYVAPHWLQDLRTNLAAISGPGGLNDPGPASATGNTAGMVIDLQAFLAMLWDNPLFYNLTSYLICGALLIIWAVKTYRSRFSRENALLALAAAVPLTMLITYHRPYDAKLLMLAVPGCALLWAISSRMRWLAVLVTTAAIVLTGEIALAIVVNVNDGLQFGTGFFGQVLRAVMMRPASLALLAMAIFFVWAYARHVVVDKAASPNGNADKSPLATNSVASF